MWDDVPRPGDELMARDAARLAALDAAPERGPEIVWFTWDRPTITLGRLQDSARALTDEARAQGDVPIVVRPTGGRAVFHVDEWTYGAVVPLAHPRLGGSLGRACRAISALIASALREAYGVSAELAEVDALATPDDVTLDRAAESAEAPGGDRACFARSYGHEIVAGGRKLAGSAQRRGPRALLQQGSLLVGSGHERLAGFLWHGGGATGERRLARQAVTLSELLGSRPDPAAFRAAFDHQWRAAVAPSQASGQARVAALDSPMAHS